MSTMSIRLRDEVESALDQLALKLERSKGWIINQALQEYLERQQEEQLRWQETLQAMQSVVEGRVVDSAAVHEWIRSWGTPGEAPRPTPGERR